MILFSVVFNAFELKYFSHPTDEPKRNFASLSHLALYFAIRLHILFFVAFLRRVCVCLNT